MIKPSEAALARAEQLRDEVHSEGETAITENFARYLDVIEVGLREAMRALRCVVQTGERSQLMAIDSALKPLLLRKRVDPLLVEARKLAGDVDPTSRALYERGDHDDSAMVQRMLIALERGVELGKGQSE